MLPVSCWHCGSILVSNTGVSRFENSFQNIMFLSLNSVKTSKENSDVSLARMRFPCEPFVVNKYFTCGEYHNCVVPESRFFKHISHSLHKHIHVSHQPCSKHKMSLDFLMLQRLCKTCFKPL